MITLDDLDRRILSELQRDVAQNLEALAERVDLSRNAIWRRIKALDEAGVIKGRVALLDAEKLGVGLSVVIMIRTSSHDPKWSESFAKATTAIPEIQGVYRMSGDLDYMLRARVADMAAYDALYQRLIRKVALSDVSASFVMEEIKETTALPL